MATITDITTGDQTVAAAGAVTGSLDTSALTGDYTVKVSVRGLSTGKKAIFAIEDTANASAYSDKVQVAVFHVVGGMPTEGVFKEFRNYDIPATRFGVANAALRVYCLSMDGTPGTVKVHGWLEQ